MNINVEKEIIELSELRNQMKVFRDREYAGEMLADMLEPFRDSDSLVFGIPSGGVPVAVIIARLLHLNLDTVVANKITPRWNSETGYGAVAFDGTTIVRQSFVKASGLSDEEVAEDTAKARNKVQRRNQLFRKGRPFPDCTGRTVIIVDDGLASGVTMEVAVEALKKAGTGRLVVAIPTGHLDSLQDLSKQVDVIYCPNVREGWSFAVADAFEQWSNLDESTVATILNDFNQTDTNKLNKT
jgi:putative phosphoribosyl transferase